MTSFFEHQKLSFRKNYIRNLIQLASADGHLDETELKVLFEIAAKRNLKEWQVKELLKDTTPFEVFIPESFLNKMTLLFDLMRLIYADGVVDESEIAYIRFILASFKLSPGVISELFIMFQNGTPDSDTWREFTESLMIEHQPVDRFVTIL
ncbi:MAG TPA: hypothetical protein VEB86_11205 [Chryseosolibacter sp.]|nr:hypothetical protein [Chryseosolibacter sp.]